MAGVFPVGEVARRTGVSTSTLRAWERRFGLLEPQRTDGGHRRYAPEDVERVRAVVALLDEGWAVDAAARFVMDGGPEAVANELGRAPGAPDDAPSGGLPVGLGAPAPLAGVTRRPGTAPGLSPSAQPGSSTPAAGPDVTGPDPTPGAPTASAETPPSGQRSISGAVAVLDQTLTETVAEPDVAATADARSPAEDDDPIDPVAVAAAYRTARRVLRATSVIEVTTALCSFVEELGGRVVAAEGADEQALPIDLAFGAPPLLPVADPSSLTRLRLESFLPELVDDARHVIDLLRSSR